MEQNEQLVIYQNKKGNVIYISMAILMTLLCFVLMLFDYRNADSDYYLGKIFTSSTPGIILLKAVMLIGIIFFGYAAIYFIKRVKAKKALFIVDDKGITDNSSAIALGFIPWQDIERIFIGSQQGNKFIELQIKDEDKYLKNLSVIKRKTIEANKKPGHQIVCITLNGSGISPENILPEIQALFIKYR